MAAIHLTRKMVDAADEIDWDNLPCRETQLVEPMELRGRLCCPVHYAELYTGKSGHRWCATRCEGEWANPKGYCTLTFTDAEKGIK